MHAIVHSADIQDRDGGGLIMATLSGLYPFLLKLYAGGGYQGPVYQNAVKAAIANLNVGIIKRSDQAKGFVVQPKRRVVERTFAWLNLPPPKRSLASRRQADAAVWPRIGNAPTGKPVPMCCSPPSGSWYEG